MNDSIPPRARRRGYLDNLRKKARLRAERAYREQFFVHKKPYCLHDFNRFYSSAMLAQGKFFNGGCKIARCWLCDYVTPSHRTNKQHDQFNSEYKDWSRGDLSDLLE
ncbi:MAG: hypothetical protein H8F28_16305 [Fibrella sp.]|nr:hypothetical protein [Armatimonadota bacterium]